MAAKITPTVAVQILANVAQFKSSLDRAAYDLKNFGNQINKIGNAIGVAFTTYEILSFGIQVSKLAGQADAVSNAFERLPGSVALMNQLKDATGRTVSEFELMQRAVQASNFGIELSKLPKLLEFATLRAQQTGQSVEYLVGSIIQGIGKKSPMVLDNLGISLIRLREELKGTGTEVASVAEYTAAVGKIIDTDLANMAGFAETAATKIERLGASWTNLKITIGDAVNETGLFNKALDGAIGTMDILSSKDITWLDKLSFFMTGTDVNALKMKAQIVAKMAAMEQRRNETSIKATEDAKKVFEEFNKKTTDYDSIRKRAALQLELKQKDFNALLVEQYNLQNFGRANNEEEINLSKLKTVYQKDFNAQIEALIAQLKKANEETIDPKELEKQLDEAAQKWEDYYKKITKGADKIAPSFLFEELSAVGLGKPKQALPLLTTETKEDLKKQFDSLIPSKSLINQLQDIQNASLKVKDGIVNDTESISKAFSSAAEGGLNEFFMGFEQVAAKQITFGQNIINAISSFMRSFGQQLIALGTAKLGLDKLLANLTIPNAAVAIGAIAAGTALVSLAGAMRSRNDLAIQKTVRTAGTSDTSYGLKTMDSIRLEVTGRLTGQGKDLIAVIDNANFDNRFRKGG